MPWGLLTFLVGGVYGFFLPGHQRKVHLLVTGLLIGLILAAVFGLLGYALGENPLGLGTDLVGFVVSFAILTLLFVLGVWLGDLLERVIHGGERTA